jgi:hypothetical protein
MARNTFSVQNEVPRGRIYDAIVTGLEGGCYSSIGVIDGATWEPAWRAAEEGKPEPFAQVECYDREQVDSRIGEGPHPVIRGPIVKLTDANIQKGVECLAVQAPHLLRNIVEENEDVIDGDALMQCIVLGEIVYG